MPIARLLAISDLHVNHPPNRRALEDLPVLPDDHLLVPGDVGDEPEDLAFAWRALVPRFRSVTWTPGNHELWDRKKTGLRGAARYRALVEVCRAHGVHTPEDPPWRYEGLGGPALVVPLFLLYDYSFRPDAVSRDAVLSWAAEDRIRPADERFLHPDPHPTLDAWSAVLVERAAARLDEAAAQGLPLVATSHYPWREDLIRFGRIQRFTPWCGTRQTEGWHRRWRFAAIVHGHLHMRATDYRDGVRFEEVALGYPRHWSAERGIGHYLREVLPGPVSPLEEAPPTRWHL